MRPSCIILDKTDFPVHELLKYDIVICSHNFLRQRYIDWVAYAGFCLAVRSHSVKRAIQAFDRKFVRPHAPLHSSLYASLQRKIAVLIIDESHDARNPESQLHAAIRSLEPHCTFLLTGTPIFNIWEDLAAQAMLLPGGGPLINLDHCRRLFGTDGDTNLVGHPQGAGEMLFRRFISALIVARPKSLLELPPLKTKIVRVDMKDHREILLEISRCVMIGRSLLSSGKRDGISHVHGVQSTGAWAILSKAQKLSLNPILLTLREADSEDEETSTGIDKTTKARMEASLQKFLEDKGLPLDLSLKDLDTDQLVSFRAVWNKVRRGSSTAVQLAENDQLPNNVDEDDAPSTSHEIELEDLRAVGISAYSDEGFTYNEDSEDENYQPDSDDADEAQSEGPNDNHESEDDEVRGVRSEGTEDESSKPAAEERYLRRKGRSDPEFTKRWLARLSRSSDNGIFSPRITAIMDQVRQIRKEYPGEKMMIVSGMVMFLDIVKEAIKRRAQTEIEFEFEIGEYNGTIKSVEERAELIRTFNHPGSGLIVLLLSAQAGGTGLNVAGASHIIISEPFWTPTLKEQVAGRAHRMPQDKEVHI